MALTNSRRLFESAIELNAPPLETSGFSSCVATCSPSYFAFIS